MFGCGEQNHTRNGKPIYIESDIRFQNVPASRYGTTTSERGAFTEIEFEMAMELDVAALVGVELQLDDRDLLVGSS